MLTNDQIYKAGKAIAERVFESSGNDTLRRMFAQYCDPDDATVRFVDEAVADLITNTESADPIVGFVSGVFMLMSPAELDAFWSGVEQATSELMESMDVDIAPIPC